MQRHQRSVRLELVYRPLSIFILLSSYCTNVSRCYACTTFTVSRSFDGLLEMDNLYSDLEIPFSRRIENCVNRPLTCYNYNLISIKKSNLLKQRMLLHQRISFLKSISVILNIDFLWKKKWRNEINISTVIICGDWINVFDYLWFMNRDKVS